VSASQFALPFYPHPLRRNVAEFSHDRRYRYTLWRRAQWQRDGIATGGAGYVAFIGLNPSTADEATDDNTVRRCVRFARDWGLGDMCMLNLFAFRATDPREMQAEAEPVGPDNDEWILRTAKGAQVVVAAWGFNGTYQERDQRVTRMLLDEGVRLYCLGRTKDGDPRHPLYVRADTLPEFYA